MNGAYKERNSGREEVQWFGTGRGSLVDALCTMFWLQVRIRAFHCSVSGGGFSRSVLTRVHPRDVRERDGVKACSRRHWWAIRAESEGRTHVTLQTDQISTANGNELCTQRFLDAR